MESWLIGLSSSIVVAIVYGLLFAQREDAIRASLKRATGGLLRRLYVRALIQAVRGGADVADSRHLAVLLIFVVLFAGIWTQATVQNIRNSVDRLVQQAHALQHTSLIGPASAATTNPQHQLQQKEQALSEEINTAVSGAEAIKTNAQPTLAIVQFIAYLLLAAAGAGWIAWVPYVLMRRQFAHEIERFSLRIQGLATSQELADLTKAELGVRDSHTLAVYVKVMRRIAARYDMPELTRSFELWDESASV